MLGILGPVALVNLRAALHPSSNDSMGFIKGSVVLTSSGSGAAEAPLPSGGPGTTATSFVTVHSQGTLPTVVRLYSRTSGDGIDRFLRVTVTRGSGTGAGFEPDPVDPTGSGRGILFQGSLAEFPTGFAEGVVDPGTWSSNEAHTYRFEITMTSDPAGQGLTGGASFVWEGRAAALVPAA